MYFQLLIITHHARKYYVNYTNDVWNVVRCIIVMLSIFSVGYAFSEINIHLSLYRHPSDYVQSLGITHIFMFIYY